MAGRLDVLLVVNTIYDMSTRAWIQAAGADRQAPTGEPNPVRYHLALLAGRYPTCAPEAFSRFRPLRLFQSRNRSKIPGGILAKATFAAASVSATASVGTGILCSIM